MSQPKMKYRWAVRRTQNEPGEFSKLVSNTNGYTTKLLQAYDHISDALETHSLEAESFRDLFDSFSKLCGIYAKTYRVDGGRVTVLLYRLPKD